MPFAEILAWAYLSVGILYWGGGAVLTRVIIRKFTLLTPDSPGMESAGECGPPPPLTILIPARDEELEIGKCLRSLLAQDYPQLRILLADDGSTDRTGEIAAAIAAADDRLVILSPGEPPGGWVGKCWALQQAFREAERRGRVDGSVLLFTDADVVFHPRALTIAVRRLLEERLDLVALLPRSINAGFWEKCLQPAIIQGLLGAGIFSEIFPDGGFPRVASGAFLLVRPEAYREAGGHRAMRHQIIEDIALATRIHRKTRRTRAYRSPDLLSLRMYHGFGEIWRGWTKNFFAGTRDRLGRAAGILAVMLLFSTAPPLVFALLLGRALSTGSGWGAAGLGGALCLLMIAVRWWGNLLTGDPPAYALLHPVAGAVMSAVLVASAWSRRFGRGTLWRGRRYPLRKQSG